MIDSISNNLAYMKHTYLIDTTNESSESFKRNRRVLGRTNIVQAIDKIDLLINKIDQTNQQMDEQVRVKVQNNRNNYLERSSDSITFNDNQNFSGLSSVF